MEISRKVYIKIIKLIEDTTKEERSNTQLADAICTLIEGIPDTNTISTSVTPTPLMSNIPTPLQTTVQNAPKKRVYEPYEKVAEGRVDGNGKFTPIPIGRGQGGITKSDGSLDVELTNDIIH